jgi:LysM repeat protein
MSTKYKIRQGDTLTDIAKRNNTTVQALAKANNISNPNRIYAGQDLIIPVAVGGITGSIGGGSTGGGTSGSTGGGSTGSGKTNPYGIPTNPTYDNIKWGDTDEGKAAWNAYQGYLNQYNNFGDFGFSKQGDLDSVYSNIKNYGDFSYDVNSDALYQQYANQYIQQGKMAMQDTIGQASAMTGGYGNSYAATAGNQAYQGYLQQLNDKVPELYQLALNKWQMGKDDLYDQYGLLLKEYEREYGLYSDEYNRLLDQLGLARNDYYDGADMHYTEQGNSNNVLSNQFNDEMSIWDANQSQSNWEKNYNLSERELKMAEEAWALEKAAMGDIGLVPSDNNSSKLDNSSKTPTVNNIKPNNSVPSAIAEKAATFKSNDALDEYLTKQYQAGKITEEQMGQLYLENEISSLSKRDWTLTDDGGVNWLWGVDNNAVVKDQYGNSYRLDKLVNALVAEGMSKNEAKDYVKKLQKTLGA